MMNEVVQTTFNLLQNVFESCAETLSRQGVETTILEIEDFELGLPCGIILAVDLTRVSPAMKQKIIDLGNELCDGAEIEGIDLGIRVIRASHD